MKSLSDVYVLSNKIGIPCIGFGTWQSPDGKVTVDSVKAAIKEGYRHIDTAQMYKNEESVGQGVKESGINREDIFITSKLSNTIRGYDATIKSFDESLRKLGTDYMDLFLIHWPNPIHFRDSWQESNADTWRAFEKLYNDGKLKSIGISNFHKHHIVELLKIASIVPMVNQIRLCPGDTQDEFVDYCEYKDILLEAYRPLGVGKIFEVEEGRQLADKYNRTVAQICIRFSLQKGFLPLPKSINESRIVENAQVFDFELSEGDVDLLSNLKGCVGYSADPDTATW